MLIRNCRRQPDSECSYKLRVLSFGVIVAVLVTAGCATRPETSAEPTVGQRTADEVAGAAQQPFEDFNITQEEIPPILLNARADPYAPPIAEDCQSMIAEIRELDGALGQDFDSVQVADPAESVVSLNTGFAVARGLALGLIPFRGVAREVTGAEAHAREVNQAVLAGTTRRAYFKGIGDRLGCEYPGSPLRQELVPGG